MQVTTHRLDLAKRVMQLHWVDMEAGEIHRKQMKRGHYGSFSPIDNRASWPWKPVGVRIKDISLSDLNYEVEAKLRAMAHS